MTTKRAFFAAVVVRVFSGALGVVAMVGCATGAVKEVNYRGSPDEVLEELYGVFPVGTPKAEVVSLARSELGLDDSDRLGSRYYTPPLKYRGRYFERKEPTIVHSYIEWELAEYRSFYVWLWIPRVIVTGAFFFDEDDRLMEIYVDIQVDSL